MHILQILPALDEGGVERGTVELNREFVRRGHSSSVISSGGRLTTTIVRDGGQHLSLDVKTKNPLTAPRRIAALRRLLVKLQPDVVHFRSRVPGWLFKFANRPLQLPYVSTVHGFNSVSRYSAIMTTGQLVICPSSAVARHIARHYHTAAEKMRVIPRGVDAKLFDPARLDQAFMREFKEQHALEGRFVVLGVGRITQLKGYEYLIRATAVAREQAPQIKTVIVGGAEQSHAEYAASLRSLVTQLNLHQQVVFVGSQSKIAEVYACGNLLVSGNHAKPEAFGRSMAEALAMNLPVVATRFGGAVDIVREGRDGWLIEPGSVEALAEKLVLATKTPLGALRDDALARFSLERMVEQTLAVYSEIVAQSAT